MHPLAALYLVSFTAVGPMGLSPFATKHLPIICNYLQTLAVCDSTSALSSYEQIAALYAVPCLRKIAAALEQFILSPEDELEGVLVIFSLSSWCQGLHTFVAI
jgi:hypothetical protein